MAGVVSLLCRGLDSRGTGQTAEVSGGGWASAVERVRDGAGTVIKQVRPQPEVLGPVAERKLQQLLD